LCYNRIQLISLGLCACHCLSKDWVAKVRISENEVASSRQLIHHLQARTQQIQSLQADMFATPSAARQQQIRPLLAGSGLVPNVTIQPARSTMDAAGAALHLSALSHQLPQPNLDEPSTVPAVHSPLSPPYSPHQLHANVQSASNSPAATMNASGQALPAGRWLISCA